MDTLSNVLPFLKPDTFVSAGLSAGGEWAIQFPSHEGIKFNAVRKGSCMLQVDGDDHIYHLKPGDCFLLTSGRPFVLGNDLSLREIPSDTIYDQAKNGIAVCNAGDEFFLVGARFHFEKEHNKLLFGQLPPVIYVPEELDQAAVLRWGLERFTKEFHTQQPGRLTIMEHLAPVMLVQVLRIYLSTNNCRQPNWLSAFSSPQLSKVIEAIHTCPENKWTVATLGEIAGMSRSGFALKFKQVIGLSPLDYVTQWRMLIAGKHLQHGEMNINEIASYIGYESDSSFSAAFKKATGKSPRHYQLVNRKSTNK